MKQYYDDLLEEEKDWEAQAKEKLESIKKSLDRLIMTDDAVKKGGALDLTELLLENFKQETVDDALNSIQDEVDECLVH